MARIPPQYETLPGFGTTYSETELRQAIAIKEVGGMEGASASTGGGSTTGAGDASAANQAIEIQRLIEIRDKVTTEVTLQQVRDTLIQVRDKLGSGGAKKFDPETLTASGTSTALDVFTVPYTRITYQLDISGLASPVICRLEGSNTGANYVNLDPNDESTTITANGIYMFSISDICLFRARFNFISGAANILINVIASV